MPTWKRWGNENLPEVLRALGPVRNGSPEHPDAEARATANRPVDASVVERAVYIGGHRVDRPETIGEVRDCLALRESSPGQHAMAWIGVHGASEDQIHELAAAFDLHPLAVEDAILAHQRPKIERYGDTLFVVLRAATYQDATETVSFGEIHVFLGPDFVITVRHSDQPSLKPVRERLEATPELLALGPEAVLYAVADYVVDGYGPVVAGLENDIDEIEEQVFESDPTVSRRIYELSQEVLGFQRAVRPLLDVMHRIEEGFQKYGTNEELQNNFRDVADHATVVNERVFGFRQSLENILTLNATLVAQTQNEEMRRLTEAGMAQNDEVKKISAWAAILFAPSLISGIYGMNFEAMPELKWAEGYPFSLMLMLVVCGTLFFLFKRNKWL